MLHFLSLLIHQVVCSNEVSLLKDVLSGAMTEHNMSLDSSLWMLVGGHIICVLFLCLDHLFGLGLVLIGGRRRGQGELCLGLTHSDAA